MCDETLSKETVEITNFIWNGNGRHLPAGELLSALITLSDSEKDVNAVANKDVADYLKAEGLITELECGGCRINPGRKSDIIDLGNKVSDAIDKELEICINKDIKSVPTILVMTVPIGMKID